MVDTNCDSNATTTKPTSRARWTARHGTTFNVLRRCRLLLLIFIGGRIIITAHNHRTKTTRSSGEEDILCYYVGTTRTNKTVGYLEILLL